MKITYCKAASNDIECIYQLSKKLIDTYESLECINYNQVMQWVRHKIETCIDKYTVILLMARKPDMFIFIEMKRMNMKSMIYIFSQNFKTRELVRQ